MPNFDTYFKVHLIYIPEHTFLHLLNEAYQGENAMLAAELALSQSVGKQLGKLADKRSRLQGYRKKYILLEDQS